MDPFPSKQSEGLPFWHDDACDSTSCCCYIRDHFWMFWEICPENENIFYSSLPLTKKCVHTHIHLHSEAMSPLSLTRLHDYLHIVCVWTITPRDAEKGKATTTQQQQHNRKAKQHNTTRPKRSFFKEKLVASGGTTISFPGMDGSHMRSWIYIYTDWTCLWYILCWGLYAYHSNKVDT